MFGSLCTTRAILRQTRGASAVRESLGARKAPLKHRRPDVFLEKRSVRTASALEGFRRLVKVVRGGWVDIEDGGAVDKALSRRTEGGKQDLDGKGRPDLRRLRGRVAAFRRYEALEKPGGSCRDREAELSRFAGKKREEKKTHSRHFRIKLHTSPP